MRRRPDDISPWQDVRRVVYTYYADGDDHGSEGDLQTAVHERMIGGTWTATETHYYRCWKDAEGNGFQHGLKYAVGPEAYQRLEQAAGDPLTAAEGRVQHEKIKQGESGTEINLRSYEYTSHSEGERTVHLVSKETVYRNEDGSGAVDTTYSYTWHSGTVQLQQRVTTLPAVPTSQNGSGASNTRTERFDDEGNLTWTMDERGFLHRNQYDPATGSLVQTIQGEEKGTGAILFGTKCAVVYFCDGDGASMVESGCQNGRDVDAVAGGACCVLNAAQHQATRAAGQDRGRATPVSSFSTTPRPAA